MINSEREITRLKQDIDDTQKRIDKLDDILEKSYSRSLKLSYVNYAVAGLCAILAVWEILNGRFGWALFQTGIGAYNFWAGHVSYKRCKTKLEEIRARKAKNQ